MSNELDTISDLMASEDHLEALNLRQRAFVTALVWQGLSAPKAAKKLGIPERSGYRWMRVPAVLEAISRELHVLRTSARASNIHRLIELRDQDRNLAAAVAAARAIEEVAKTYPATNPNQRVGYVIITKSDYSPPGAIEGRRSPIEHQWEPPDDAIDNRPELPALPFEDNAVIDAER